MSFPPIGSNPAQINRDQPARVPLEIQGGNTYIRPFSPEGADAQLYALDERLRNRTITYSSPSSSTTTTTTTTTSDLPHLPPLQRSSTSVDDRSRPPIVNVYSRQERGGRLPSFGVHFKNIEDAPQRAGLPLPELVPLKEGNLSPEIQSGLLYYDQLLRPSEYDNTPSRRGEFVKAITSLHSSGLSSNAMLIHDYSNLLEFKIIYSLLGVERNFIDFKKQIKETNLSESLAYLIQAEKNIIYMQENTQVISEHEVSKCSDQGEYVGDYIRVYRSSPDLFVRASMLCFLQSLCWLKKNSKAIARNELCGVHSAFHLFQKSKIIINRLSEVIAMNIQIAVARMNSNLSILNYEIACRLHEGSCFEHHEGLTSDTTEIGSN